MNNASKKFARILPMPAAFGLMLVFSVLTIGQDGPPRGIGLPDDWSHHRLVFSSPGSGWQAFVSGRFGHWLQTVNDPRFSFQLQKRENAAKSHASLPAILDAHRDDRRHDESFAGEDGDVDDARADSSAPLPRGLTRLSDPHPAREKHRHGRQPAGPNDLSLDWSEDMGSGAAAGLGVYPAKFSFGTSTANCGSATKPDFVVYNTGLAGSASQASILAYDNLYAGCTGTVPSTFWAFNTGGTVVTSPTLSADGSQVAFVQTSSGAASLVLLKWASSNSETASSPMTLTAVANSAYRACTAPCMTTIAFSGGANDSGSPPFYDFSGTDALYAGDDAGKLHKFTGVFNGTPAESTSPWPVAVSSAALGGPVLDGGSGNIFVADYLLNTASVCTNVTINCGFLYSVSASSGSVVGTSGRLDFNLGIVDAPLVDSTAGRVYVFAGSDGNFNNPSSPCAANTPCAGVYQFPTNFTSGTGTEASLGVGTQMLFAGTFDNAYFTSANAASPTGHLYVMGNTGAADNTLYQVTITSNSMNTTATVGPAIATNFSSDAMAAAGLQLAEFFNGTKDFIFASVLIFGAPSGCSGSLTNGCVMGFDVTTGTISSSTMPTGATAEVGGISGVVIDNSSSFSGASNIYFTTLANQTCPTSGGTGGCAIQTSQAVP